VGADTARPTIGAGSAVTAAGSAQGGTSSLAAGAVTGAGAVSPVQPIISVSATVTGSGSCASGSSSAQSPAAAVAGSGSASATPTIVVSTNIAGVGLDSANAQVGSLTWQVTAAIAGVGSVNLVTPILSAQAGLAGVAQLAALSQARESAVLAGLGRATGATTQHAPNIKAGSSASVADLREGTLTPAFSRHIGGGSKTSAGYTSVPGLAVPGLCTPGSPGSLSVALPTVDLREGTVSPAASRRASASSAADVRESVMSVS
jgi:hypothetical protein